MPSYWFPNLASRGNLQRVGSEGAKHQPPQEPAVDDDDVQAEESKMRSLLHHRTGGYKTTGSIGL